MGRGDTVHTHSAVACRLDPEFTWAFFAAQGL